MKNKDLFTLRQGIQSAGSLSGVKLAYALAVNLKQVDAVIEALQTGITPSDDFNEYETARLDLCKQFADKDRTLT